MVYSYILAGGPESSLSNYFDTFKKLSICCRYLLFYNNVMVQFLYYYRYYYYNYLLLFVIIIFIIIHYCYCLYLTNHLGTNASNVL